MVEVVFSQEGSGSPFELRKSGLKSFRLIAVTIVAEDRHDRMSGPDVPGESDGAGNVDAGRAADADAFFSMRSKT